MKIAFKTFGCRANSNDTDALYLEARHRGYEIVDEAQAADAYVINTCTVTENADRDARHQANRFKRQNPEALVAMVGCYAQVAKDELLALPEVDFVVGTANKFKILDHFNAAWKKEGPSRDQVEPAKGFLPGVFSGSRYARASIKIQDGCNYRCSFCIIPQARGRSRSLPLENILGQVEEAERQGFEEVVLTGIHLAHYGWDQGTDLIRLIRAILAKETGPRIRISTLDPFEIPEGLIDMLGEEKRLCPHFHIALQSGSDFILKRMRRLYAAQEFVDTTQKIERKHPDTFIGVDVIVGFPGETLPEFNKTIEVLENSFWSKLHVFSFSARKGTDAALLDGVVNEKEIAARSKILRKLSDERYQSFLESQVGKEKKVVLEKPSAKHPGIWLGHTENYLPTYSVVGEGRTKQALPCIIRRREGDRLWAVSV